MDAVPRYPGLVAYDPIRLPGWRWLRAQYLVDNGMNATRRRDDEPTRRAVHYLRDMGYAHGRLPRRLIAIYSDIHAARSIHEGDSRTALDVQARLLARQTAADISRMTGVATSAIEAYERLFFSVSDHLDAKDWVMSHAICYGPLGDVEPRNAVILKKYAFHAGPLLIDLLSPFLVGGKDLLVSLPDLSTLEGRLELSVRLLVAVELLPEDAKNLRKLQQIALLVRECEQKRHVNPRPTPVLVQSVGTLLAAPQLAALLQRAPGTVKTA